MMVDDFIENFMFLVWLGCTTLDLGLNSQEVQGEWISSSFQTTCKAHHRLNEVILRAEGERNAEELNAPFFVWRFPLRSLTMTTSNQGPAPSSELVSVILFGGLPASGKSTLARKIKDHFHATTRVLHVEYDAFEDEIASKQLSKDSIAAWKEARRTAQQHLEDVLKTSENGSLLVLMDDNFHLRGMRKQIHRMLLGYRPIRFGIIWLETDLDACLQRNGLRGRQISHDVILKMKENLELPRSNWESCWISTTEDTAFSDIISFVEDCDDIKDVLDDSIDPEQQERDRLETLKNQRHLWDKQLRNWVGQVAKHDPKLARSANAARKKMLALIKEGSQEIVTEEDLRHYFVKHMAGAANMAGDDLVTEVSTLLQH